MRSGTDQTGPVSRRSRGRFARRQWARRWLAWRPVVAAAALLSLVGGTVWLVLFSSVLAVAGVEVRGADTVAVAEIRAAAAVPSGEPLARLDLAVVESRVEALASVRSADVSRKWPDEVLVSIEERVPVAVVEIAGRLRAMDETGVVFREFPRAPAGLPRVRTALGTSAAALREAAEVIAALPPRLAVTVDHVEVESVDRILLALRDGRLVRWGSADESTQKARVLEALLDQRARVYDVSAPGQPTTSG